MTSEYIGENLFSFSNRQVGIICTIASVYQSVNKTHQKSTRTEKVSVSGLLLHTEKIKGVKPGLNEELCPALHSQEVHGGTNEVIKVTGKLSVQD